MGRLLLAALLLGPVIGRAASPPLATDSFNRLMREAVIALLREGNHRFVTNQSRHPNLDPDRRIHTATDGQEPFATILACADSRVPVELLFDRGIGDLFVVRGAGNVATTSELASLEYGVVHLRTPLLLVLGHSQCGAVTAVVQGTKLQGHLPALAEKIHPALLRARTQAATGPELIAKTIEENVWQTIADVLRQSPEIRQRVAERSTIVLGAVYALDTGEVRWLGPHPDEAGLLTADPASTANSDTATEPAPPDLDTAQVPPLPLVEPEVDPLQTLRNHPVHRPPTHPARSF